MLKDIKDLRTNCYKRIMYEIANALVEVVDEQELLLDNGMTFSYSPTYGFEVDYQVYEIDFTEDVIMYTSIDCLTFDLDRPLHEILQDFEDHYNVLKDLAIDDRKWGKVALYKSFEDIFRSAKVWYLAG